ncbi:MAG TPA: sugar kinase [Verrucomicrobiota bacterium]|nr:sugar kinase [Verrucomicrobiota bacterium]HNU49349.1 sugar kinase [Verrucomicrobiota bacterium]
MKRHADPRFVLVTRPTRLAELMVRHTTVGQARFHLERLGADFSDFEAEDRTYQSALARVRALLARQGRLQVLERRFLAHYLFQPEDRVVVLGPDGLVANTLKYVAGQPIVGVNPDPTRWDGRLLPFRVDDLERLLPQILAGERPLRRVTMALAALNTGLELHAVNDLFIGLSHHGSARYRLTLGGRTEEQSSSGIVVSTGLGSTGWLSSLLTGAATLARTACRGAAEPAGPAPTPSPRIRSGFPLDDLAAESQFPWDADYLYYTVREPFPSRTTAATLVFGRISAGHPLVVESRMPERGVIFSDGLEHDRLEFNAGARVTVGLAERQGFLVA